MASILDRRVLVSQIGHGRRRELWQTEVDGWFAISTVTGLSRSVTEYQSQVGDQSGLRTASIERV